jgi:tyrosyl-tRNA synthetase
MELKKRLAREIVTQLNDEEAARKAEEHFERTFQKKEIPEDKTRVRSGKLVDMLVEAGVAKSRSEARRLIMQGAVDVDGKKVTDPNRVVPPDSIIKAGKREYIQSI